MTSELEELFGYNTAVGAADWEWGLVSSVIDAMDVKQNAWQAKEILVDGARFTNDRVRRPHFPLSHLRESGKGSMVGCIFPEREFQSASRTVPKGTAEASDVLVPLKQLRDSVGSHEICCVQRQ